MTRAFIFYTPPYLEASQHKAGAKERKQKIQMKKSRLPKTSLSSFASVQKPPAPFAFRHWTFSVGSSTFAFPAPFQPPLPPLSPVKTPHFTIQNWTFSVGSSIFALILCGCQILTYRTPTGERLTRSSLGANTSISSLTLEGTTNGIRRVELHGYKNDTSQALGTVTEAAVKAAISAVKP